MWMLQISRVARFVVILVVMVLVADCSPQEDSRNVVRQAETVAPYSTVAPVASVTPTELQSTTTPVQYGGKIEIDYDPTNGVIRRDGIFRTGP